MPESLAYTRENWYRLTKAAYGLPALAETLDSDVGQTDMDTGQREYPHGLTSAVVAIALNVRDLVMGMDEEGILEKLPPTEQGPSA